MTDMTGGGDAWYKGKKKPGMVYAAAGGGGQALGVDENPKIKTPEIMDTAAMAAGDLQLGMPDEATRERVYGYRAAPHIKLAEKRIEAQNKYFQNQGMRFSTERRGRITEIGDESTRQMMEGVMVPQIEREQADLRANIGLATQVGEVQFRQNQATAEFTQRQNEFASIHGLDQEKFAEAVRQFDEGVRIQDENLAEQVRQFDLNNKLDVRKTTVLELNAAADRANAFADRSGQFIDPVTGLSLDTIQEKIRKDNNRARRAAEIGKWWEPDLYVDPVATMAFLELNQDDFLGEQPDGTDPPPADDGGAAADDGTSGEAADDYKAWTETVEAEMAITSTFPDWTQKTGWPADTLSAVMASLGTDDFEQFMTDMESGKSYTMQEIYDMVDEGDNKTSDWQTFVDAMGDQLEGTIDPNDPWASTVRWAGNVSGGNEASDLGGEDQGTGAEHFGAGDDEDTGTAVLRNRLRDTLGREPTDQELEDHLAELQGGAAAAGPEELGLTYEDDPAAYAAAKLAAKEETERIEARRLEDAETARLKKIEDDKAAAAKKASDDAAAKAEREKGYFNGGQVYVERDGSQYTMAANGVTRNYLRDRDYVPKGKAKAKP